MAEISAKLVKDLRDRTGAGMMDCKKALKETDGDMEKAAEWLRKKGIASADKKAGRVAAEGLVHSYIHTGARVGVLVEVNCETDFVAKRDEFRDLAHNVAMQIAACPNVEFVQVEEIPAAVVEREKSIEMGREDLAGKPDNIKEKIVAGRIDKRLGELCLLSQPYIRDQSITVAELVKQAIAQLGENIQIRRFSRFVLGEGIEKEEANFAEEVAAAQGSSAPVEEAKPAEAAPEPAAEPTPEAAPEPAAEAAPEPAPEPAPKPAASKSKGGSKKKKKK